MFDDSVKKHFEGIMAKKLDGKYEAGVRGWNWIKFKKAMSKKLMDTVDVLVMGYTYGEGKRTSFGVGQFLTGVYDEKQDKFKSVSKIGTGLTDEQFREFIKRVKPLETKDKPNAYDIDKLLTPDVWLVPKLVVEVGSDEITRSAVHTAGRVLKPSKSGKAFDIDTPGFALRFPRLEKFRDDKKAEDATTVAELSQMFTKQSQKK
jgi:DNA ligase-1